MIQIQISIMLCILKTLLRVIWLYNNLMDISGGKLDIDNALQLYNFHSHMNEYQYCN